jgi:hypothetical protein
VPAGYPVGGPEPFFVRSSGCPMRSFVMAKMQFKKFGVVFVFIFSSKFSSNAGEVFFVVNKRKWKLQHPYKAG